MKALVLLLVSSVVRGYPLLEVSLGGKEAKSYELTEMEQLTGVQLGGPSMIPQLMSKDPVDDAWDKFRESLKSGEAPSEVQEEIFRTLKKMMELKKSTTEAPKIGPQPTPEARPETTTISKVEDKPAPPTPKATTESAVTALPTTETSQEFTSTTVVASSTSITRSDSTGNEDQSKESVHSTSSTVNSSEDQNTKATTSSEDDKESSTTEEASNNEVPSSTNGRKVPSSATESTDVTEVTTKAEKLDKNSENASLKPTSKGVTEINSVDVDGTESETSSASNGLVQTTTLSAIAEARTSSEEDDRTEAQQATVKSTTTEAPHFGCTGKIGLFPDEDCTYFWSCLGMSGYRLQCPGPLYFNPDNQVCDWPQNVQNSQCIRK